MLPKKHRLERPNIQKVLAASRNFYSKHFSFRVLPSSTTAFSIVVSKKVAKAAVQRNAIRRRGYAALERLIPKVTNPAHGIFFAKKGADNLTSGIIGREFEELLKSSGVIS